MVGSTYVRRVNEDLQLLLSFQVLSRDRNGNITINEALIQYVEEIIKTAYIKPNKIAYV